MKRICFSVVAFIFASTVVWGVQDSIPKVRTDDSNYIIPRGLPVIVRLGNTLNTRETQKGEVVTLVTTQLIPLNDHLALPQGLKLHAVVDKVMRPGRIRGRARIVIHPTRLELNENTSIPFVLGEVRLVEKALGDTYYRSLGDRDLLFPGGRIGFTGHSSTAEDVSEILRNPLSVGILWIPTFLKRGSDLIVDQGFPLIVTFGADLAIPKGSVEVLEIVPMCPCDQQKKNSSEKSEKEVHQ